MIAAAGRKVFDDPGWLFEFAYTGFRALLFADSSGVRFISERGSNLVGRLPELEAARKELKGLPCVLDGYIVAGNGNAASFRDLRHRYAKAGITALRAKEKVSLKYVAVDVLTVKGRAVLDEPLSKRKKYLGEVIGKPARVIAAAKTINGRGIDLLDEAEERGYEGIVAKRLDSVYEPGKRSKAWLRFKNKNLREDPEARRNVFNR